MTNAGVSVTPNSAGSSISTGKRDIIRVTPTLTDVGAMTAGDALFSSAEIPGIVREEGGFSKIIAAFVVSEAGSQAFNAHIVLTEKAVTLGTPNATANVAFDDLIAANVIGTMMSQAGADTDGDLDNANIVQLAGYGTDANHEFSLPILVKAGEGDTKIYFGAVLQGSYNAQYSDSLQFIFHIEH